MLVGIAASSLSAALLPLVVSPAINQAASISTSAVDTLSAVFSAAPNGSVFSVLVVVAVAADSVTTPAMVCVAAYSVAVVIIYNHLLLHMSSCNENVLYYALNTEITTNSI